MPHAVGQSWSAGWTIAGAPFIRRERCRLGGGEHSESDELLAYWTGQLPEAPVLSVAFSRLRPHGKRVAAPRWES